MLVSSDHAFFSATRSCASSHTSAAAASSSTWKRFHRTSFRPSKKAAAFFAFVWSSLSVRHANSALAAFAWWRASKVSIAAATAGDGVYHGGACDRMDGCSSSPGRSRRLERSRRSRARADGCRRMASAAPAPSAVVGRRLLCARAAQIIAARDGAAQLVSAAAGAARSSTRST